MSDTTPIPPASERERFEAWADSRKGASLRHSMDGGFDYPLGRLLREAFEAGAALSNPSTPQGWKLVPVEPTLDMGWAYLDAARADDPRGAEELRFSWPGYRAMLNAAPPPLAQGDKP